MKFVKNNKGIAYANAPFAFDIEVSSFYRNIKNPEISAKNPPKGHELEWEKVAVEYAFVIGINGKCHIGRGWDDAMACFERIVEFYGLGEKKRVMIWIHNLSYEFQFIRNRFDWDTVFSLDERDPVKAITKSGIEFRCSYHLSGYSLASVGKNLTKYHVEKMVGDLDYDKIRSPETPLTKKELGYILHDGLVVMCYIQERMEADGNILRIPMTKTGYVRKYCRKMCLYGGKGGHRNTSWDGVRYRRMMSRLTIEPDEYKQLKRAFQGGFTHADPCYSGRTMEDVTSFDFTSSYPYCMVAFKYPMEKGKKVEIHSRAEFERYISLYCCLFDAEIEGLKSKIVCDHPLSFSKTWMEGHYLLDNGRVVEAEKLKTTMTEQDYLIYKDFYSWERFSVSNFRIYKKGYLPTSFVSAILTLYRDKTKLKGLEDLDSKINYLRSKEQLNSCYGMTVTDICRDEILYEDGEWGKASPDLEESIERYNNSKTRFLFYPWGVWVTAYARRNLFSGIKACGLDYLYADTDSIKVIHAERHMDYINLYNKCVRVRLERASKHHKIPFEYFEPETVKGEKKLIGVWDYDGHYKRFKTLGAKRYMVECDDGTHSLTVSGLDKRSAIPYLEELSKKKCEDIFSLFEDGMTIPKGHAGRRIHTYIDHELEGDAEDYKGKRFHYDELSSIHMEESEYTLSLASAYIDYLMGIREVRR